MAAGGDGNLSIRLQTLGLDGQPQLEQDVVLAMTLDDAPFSGSAWMPRLAANDAGDLAIVGTRAVEAADRFRSSSSGSTVARQPLGDTVAFAPIVDVFHDTPHLVVHDSGDVTAAWVRTEDFELREVELGRVVGDSFEGDNPVPAADGAAQGPALALTDHGVLLAVGEPQATAGGSEWPE